MKTSELIGPALDWAVAKCENWDDYNDDGIPYLEIDSSHMRRRYVAYSPSTDWAQGGPIIDREKIKLLHEASEVYSHDAKWWATTDRDYEDPVHREFGPTPLIATMRCYVASKLGNEVEIPEELK